jgi:hypothetical protein
VRRFRVCGIAIANTKQLRSARGARWWGYVLSSLVTLVLFADGLVNLFKPSISSAEMAATGFPLELSSTLGAISLASAVLYAMPRTSVLGAICITGFLGGAICTHLRVGDIGSMPQIVSAIIGIATWAGLYLRFDAIRMCLPLVDLSDRRAP